jgi:glucose-6-phosphate isomerase
MNKPAFLEPATIDIELLESLQNLQSNKTYLFDPKIDIQSILDFAANIKKNYNTLLIVGFGASCLNAKALLSCLEETSFSIFFIDNVDQGKIKCILSAIDITKTAIFAISLSGETDEVICLIKYLEPDPKNLFIATRSNSTLHGMANALGASYIKYPACYNVGRCALFSPIFLIIAAIAGVNIATLFQAGVDALRDLQVHDQVVRESRWMLSNYHNNKTNMVIISYVNRLKGLMQWLEQMIAESLGKNKFGLMPYIAWGSRYEHSMLQLFLDGPDDKMYKVFCNDLSTNDPINLLLKNHEQAVIRQLNKQDKPLKICQISLINEVIIAKIIIKYIIMIDLIARKQKINPFNQPAVENLKLNIR